MVGLSYAAVPLYDLYCRVTGYGGTPQRASAAPTTVSDRVITVRYDDESGASRVEQETQPGEDVLLPDDETLEAGAAD